MRRTSDHMRSYLTLPLVRSLLLIVGLSSFSVLAQAQISLVHVTSCGPQTFPTSTCTIPSTGNENVIVVGWTSANGGGGTTIATVTDNAGNFYQEAGAAKSTDTAANTMADIWFAGNSIGGATVVTITPSPSGATGSAVIWEFSGVQPYSPLDQTAVLNSQPATTAPLGASVVTTSPAEVVVGIANVQGTVTGIENSFTLDSTASGEGWAHLITSASGTYTPQWTTSASGTFCSSTVSFKAATTAGGACDLNQDGIVNVVDVQLATNIDLGLLACPVDIDEGVCGSTLVNQIVTAALGEGCSATVTHSVSVTWTASPSPNIAGYNVYRSNTSGGTYSLLSALVTTTSYKDADVVAGETYYYVVTAVNTSNQESASSTQAQATVPITI
jgi:hypothetical protein